MGPTVIGAGRRLAEAVKAFEALPSSNNKERMFAARQEFDRLLEIAG